MRLHSWLAFLGGVLFLLGLFMGVVLLHEYGHALTARGFGVRTRDIALYPIGGVARLERIPEEPIQELWVALAGPVVNFAIAALLWIGLFATGGLPPLVNPTLVSSNFWPRLLLLIVRLAAFNLLPSFPMDGRRVLRALLAMHMDYLHVTQVSAAVGQGMAFLFGFAGLVADPWMLFIAIFVWIGAKQKFRVAGVKSSLGSIPVSRAMQTNFESPAPQDTVACAVELVLAGSQQDCPAVKEGRVLGVLERDTYIKALAGFG